VFKTFNDWLFDGNIKSEIPKELVKYNSPITNKYVISLFLNTGFFNYYLNKYMNKNNLYFLKREDVFNFVKEFVIKNKFTRRHIPYLKRYYSKNFNTYDKLREIYPEMKNSDIVLLCEIVENSEDKDKIYYSLGITKDYEKEKIKKSDKKNKEIKDKYSLKDLMKNFNIIMVESS